MNYLFFLIVFLIPLPLAYAEVGKNFDTISLDNGLTQWTSHYDRIWYGDSWENYLISNNPINLEFESANLSFLFDKASCNFKLLNPESETVAINVYDFALNIDGLPTVLPICTLESFSQTDDKVSFTINRGLFKTLYDMNPSGSMEWTHEIDNNKGKASTFTIIETCTDCIAKSIDGNRIDFGSYTLDTKNEVHNTVKETRADKGDYIIEYEKTISDKEKLIIDPIFTSNNPTFDGELQDGDNDNNCEASPASFLWAPAQTQVGKYTNAAAFDCGRVIVEFDTSSLSAITVLDSDLSFQNNAGTNPVNCDYVGMAARPKTASNATNWAGVDTGTVLVNNDATCIAAGNSKNVDLSATGDAYIQTQIDTLGWVGIGIKTDTDLGVLDGSSHVSVFCPEESACTPDFTLIITYKFTFGAVTDLVATDIRGTAVDLDWSTPAGDAPDGYQIT